MAGILGCEVGRWPIKYLGMPLSGNPKSVSFLDLVVEKVSKKLAWWKRLYISLSGRITLIKASMANILVYYMPFKMSVKVALSNKKIQRDF